jgi:hypothetical protein
MSYTLTIRKEAEFDIDEQFNYYEEKREGLGHDYLLCIEEALDKLQRNPLINRKNTQRTKTYSNQTLSLPFILFCSKQ